MKISIVTPWPPQHTGIADYAFDLVAGLHSSGVEVTVWTDCDHPIPVDGLPIRKLDKNSLPDLSQSDLILYQMGNNTHFHLYMIELIKKYRGIVHLHDIVLHHLMAWLTWVQGDVPSYLALIEKWYGPNIRKACGDLLASSVPPWDSEIVTEIPLFQEVLQHADACIVHSYFAREKIETSFPDLNIYKIDQIYKENGTVGVRLTRDKALRIGVFGGVDPQKRVDICIEAFADLLTLRGDCELHIVGSVDKRCEGLLNVTKRLAIEDQVIFHHRVSDDLFYSLLSTMDVLIALRYPTMGETSAIVMRAMKNGVPVIVNNIGWYAELPDFVDKIDIRGDMKASLLAVLSRYLDPHYLQDKKESSLKHANESLSFEKNIALYKAFLTREYHRRLWIEPFSKVLHVIEEMDLVQKNPENDQIFQNLLAKTSILFRGCQE
jgi:glycosyltransferase involved in cell wall biosynthesis